MSATTTGKINRVYVGTIPLGFGNDGKHGHQGHRTAGAKSQIEVKNCSATAGDIKTTRSLELFTRAINSLASTRSAGPESMKKPTEPGTTPA